MKDFNDRPSARTLSLDDGYGLVILLDDDFRALLHFSQHGVKVASHFGLAHMDSTRRPHYGTSAVELDTPTTSSPISRVTPRGRYTGKI